MNSNVKVALLSVSMFFVGMQANAQTIAPGGQGRDQPQIDGRSVGARPPGRNQRADGRGWVLDERNNHGRYYPAVGTVSGSLPAGYRSYYRGGDRYYFNGGIWYAPRGAGFVVVRPPPGLVISTLPPYYSMVWLEGTPYYYADNVYYAWQPDQNGYAVVAPPENADQPSVAPEDPRDAQDDLIIYPKNGQSKDQQAADQYECHGWARNQTGFDPTQEGGGIPPADADRRRNNYNRAMSACLQGRGYQVN